MQYIKPKIISTDTFKIKEHLGPIQTNYIQIHYIQTGVPERGGNVETESTPFSYNNQSKETIKIVQAKVIENKIVIS